jgi:hypothetical protein
MFSQLRSSFEPKSLLRPPHKFFDLELFLTPTNTLVTHRKFENASVKYKLSIISRLSKEILLNSCTATNRKDS